MSLSGGGGGGGRKNNFMGWKEDEVGLCMWGKGVENEGRGVCVSIFWFLVVMKMKMKK